ncbi:putative 23 kDa piroplasm membrane protein [Theileria parva strain Muguga]|uniref:23 kDa piroplasm membrane protein n=1 Tax=Theileria parva TaxID=5875 RepID=P23_THEPA|nr:putative 23 kDa piroplasm membrane protein [Theileria parva strain Muguga]Q4N4T9.1 RecName: Full=23 kDa piroplasm membrane protein; AltName: Full=p23; Flags: Precursor [Theileria parva]EAN32834.1 putative 23 kDa piroplasm membrane protein [Theileria parva strain Muguga]|eukprot:XP_765117.1 23 kDa piroplasm surface protein [Theileria parva strain Muguga]
MNKYFKVFFFVLLTHALKSALIFGQATLQKGLSLDIDKDSKATDRLVVKHFDSDKQGYKAYTFKKEGWEYVNVKHVYFGERLLRVGRDQDMKCDYVHYVKVFWKGELAPFLIKMKYYNWAWVSTRLHFRLTPELTWAEVFVPTIDENSEEGYMKLFKKRMDDFVSQVGEDRLATYKPFTEDPSKKRFDLTPTDEKEDTNKKKYVLMVVVVVVFVVVASLVVFLVKFCLK